MSPAPEPFRVLYVCTGNICRSPLAERMLRRELHERLGDDAGLFRVESAGVQGLVGEAMDPLAAAQLETHGGDPSEFEARRIDPEIIRQADLVLTANRKHRATVVRLDPTAARRAFTIREFASLADTVDVTKLPDWEPETRLLAMLDEVSAARGSIRPEDRRDLDVADPYGQPVAAHQAAASSIAEATVAAADLLALTVQPSGTTSAEAADRVNARRAKAQPKTSARRTSYRPRGQRLRRVGTATGIVVLLLLAAAAWLGWSAFSAKRDLEAGRPLVGQVRQAVLAGDTSAARTALSSLQQHTRAASSRTSGPLWSAAERLPLVGDDAAAVRTVAGSVDEVATTILPPLVRVGDAARPERLRVAGNRINLAPLEAAAPTLDRAARDSRQVQARVAGVALGGLTGTVRGAVGQVTGQVDQLASTTQTAARAAALLPPMLGADGERRYFMAFQNNAEARGTGGLLGAYGILSADHGRLRLVRLGSNSDLQPPERLAIDLGKAYRTLYAGQPPYWVNGNVSAHFPYAGRIWSTMWRQQTGQRIDGVIATDPVAMGYVLQATGPTRIPNGDEINADNAVRMTMKGIYERYPTLQENTVRDRFLQGIAQSVFDKLLSGQSSTGALTEQLTKAADEQRFLVYSSHADEQRRLEQTTLAGAVPQTGRPFAGLVVNNYSGNKLDYYLDRSMTYSPQTCRTTDGRRHSRIVVTLTNNAPDHGLPAYADQRLDTANFPGGSPAGANTDLVEVLATSGAELLQARLDGEQLLVANGEERGHPVYAFPVTTRSGQTRRVVLDLTEPAAAGRPLLLGPQPLVRPMSQQVERPGC